MSDFDWGSYQRLQASTYASNAYRQQLTEQALSSQIDHMREAESRARRLRSFEIKQEVQKMFREFAQLYREGARDYDDYRYMKEKLQRSYAVKDIDFEDGRCVVIFNDGDRFVERMEPVRMEDVKPYTPTPIKEKPKKKTPNNLHKLFTARRLKR